MSESLAHSFPTEVELGGWLPLYQVEQQVHVGRDSALYLGHQSALDRMVVIEVIPEPSAEKIPPLLDRLRARGRLVHPGITAVYDFGRTPTGFLYLVTEHVEGRSLGSLIVERQIKPKNAFPLAIEICEALQTIHDHELAHGALSPATVLVNQEGRAKLTCMGLAVTETGELSWLEPFQGSAQADMRDLGITLHWMFARCEPGDDGRLSRDLPPSFASVLRRCLGQDPAKELHHPSAVAEALHEALRSEQVRGEPKMILTPGASAAAQQAGLPASLPQAPPSIKPGKVEPIARQHRPSFYQRLDAFVWRAFSTGLHLCISLLSIGSLILLVLFKDRIVIEQAAPEDESIRVETVVVESPPEPLPAEVPAQPPAMITEPPPPVPAASMVEVKPEPTPPPPPLPTREERLADLRAQYVAAVQLAANHALETVRLDDLPYLQKELQLLQNGGDIPTVDEPDLPATLKAMRQRYRETYLSMTR